MANDYYKTGDKTFLKCKQCNTFKELNDVNWYKHKEGFMWVLWRCKECIKAWRKTEHEREMARKRDMDRYYNNPERRAYIFETSTERRKRKWYWALHLKTGRYIKKAWLRPDKCPICGYEWRIIAHHPSYEKRNEIAFCCQPCHDKIHQGEIEDYEVINILDFI